MRPPLLCVLCLLLTQVAGEPNDPLQQDLLHLVTTALCDCGHPVLERAFVTLVSTDEYAVGAAVLACQLAKFRTGVPLVILVDEVVSARALQVLQGYKDHIQEVRRVRNVVHNVTARKKDVRIGTYTKLNLWATNIKLGLFMDSDSFPLRDPSPFLRNFPRDKDFANVGGNSGVFVFRSSPRDCAAIHTTAITSRYRPGPDPTEQDILMHYWNRQPERRLALPPGYNHRPHYWNPHPKTLEFAVIVHWIGNPKPWSRILGRRTSIEGYNPVQRQPRWSHVLYQNALYNTLVGACTAEARLLEGINEGYAAERRYTGPRL